MTGHRAIAAALVVTALAATPGCYPRIVVNRAQFVVSYEALPGPEAADACYVGVNLESGDLRSFVQRHYPQEEWRDQYRSRLLERLEVLRPGEEYAGWVSTTDTVLAPSFERSTEHPVSFVDTCLSSRGSYRCMLPTSHGLSATATCSLSPFLATELRPEDGPPQLELDYTVEACRAGSCQGGWILRVRDLRPIARR